eukprot:6189434-Pleurochrysis_carterae.AAC.3
MAPSEQASEELNPPTTPLSAVFPLRRKERGARAAQAPCRGSGLHRIRPPTSPRHCLVRANRLHRGHAHSNDRGLARERARRPSADPDTRPNLAREELVSADITRRTAAKEM